MRSTRTGVRIPSPPPFSLSTSYSDKGRSLYLCSSTGFALLLRSNHRDTTFFTRVPGAIRLVPKNVSKKKQPSLTKPIQLTPSQTTYGAFARSTARSLGQTAKLSSKRKPSVWLKSLAKQAS